MFRTHNVDIKAIEPEVPHIGRGTIIDPHTAKQKSKFCPGETPLDFQLQGRDVTGEGREWEERTDDVTDRGKDQLRSGIS